MVKLQISRRKLIRYIYCQKVHFTPLNNSVYIKNLNRIETGVLFLSIGKGTQKWLLAPKFRIWEWVKNVSIPQFSLQLDLQPAIGYFSWAF